MVLSSLVHGEHPRFGWSPGAHAALQCVFQYGEHWTTASTWKTTMPKVQADFWCFPNFLYLSCFRLTRPCLQLDLKRFGITQLVTGHRDGCVITSPCTDQTSSVYTTLKGLDNYDDVCGITKFSNHIHFLIAPIDLVEVIYQIEYSSCSVLNR